MRSALYGVGLLALVFGMGCRSVLEPKVDVPQKNPSGAWNRLLGEVVTDEGLVDYDHLEANREVLDAYVAWLAKPRERMRRHLPRHAFWINAYNALVMYAVLEDGRPHSVMDVDGWWPKPGSGFFLERAFRVDGHPVSLWEIEHERLRHKTLDFRDHAALNCASKSCPPLRDSLYGEAQIEGQLADQMARWVNDPERGVTVEGGVASFSPIFDWFAYDFAFQTVGQDLCTTLSMHAEHDLARKLRRLARKGCPHTFRDYDWSLNDASGQHKAAPEGDDERDTDGS